MNKEEFAKLSLNEIRCNLTNPRIKIKAIRPP